MKEHDNDRNVGSGVSLENMSHDLDSNTSQHVPDSSFTNGQDKDEESFLHPRTQEDHLQGGLETGSSIYVAEGSFEGRSKYGKDKGGFPTHLINEKDTPSTVLCPEDAFSYVNIECGSLNHGNSTAPSSQADTISEMKSSESCKLATYSLKPVRQTPSIYNEDVPSAGHAGNHTSQPAIDDGKTRSFPCASAGTNFEIDKGFEKLSLDFRYEAGIDNDNLDESEGLTTALNNPEGHFPDDCQAENSKELTSQQLHSAVEEDLEDLPASLDSKTAEAESMPYDPSLWTPMEVMSATGNEDIRVAEHPLKLKSTYTEVEVHCTYM